MNLSALPVLVLSLLAHPARAQDGRRELAEIRLLVAADRKLPEAHERLKQLLAKLEGEADPGAAELAAEVVVAHDVGQVDTIRLEPREIAKNAYAGLIVNGERLFGFLVAGLNPYRPLDGELRLPQCEPATSRADSQDHGALRRLPLPSNERWARAEACSRSGWSATRRRSAPAPRVPQAARSPWRNAVTRNLGATTEVEVDMFGDYSALEPHVVVLCSDGIHRVVDQETVERLLEFVPARPAWSGLRDDLDLEIEARKPVHTDGRPVRIWCFGEHLFLDDHEGLDLALWIGMKAGHVHDVVQFAAARCKCGLQVRERRSRDAERIDPLVREEAIVLGGIKNGIDGEIINIVDDETITSREFLELHVQNGVPIRFVSLPKALSYPLYCTLGLLSRARSTAGWPSRAGSPPGRRRSRAGSRRPASDPRTAGSSPTGAQTG